MALQLCKGSGTREQWQVAVAGVDVEEARHTTAPTGSSVQPLLWAARAANKFWHNLGRATVVDTTHGDTTLLSRGGLQVVPPSRRMSRRKSVQPLYDGHPHPHEAL